MTEPNQLYPEIAKKWGITPQEVRQILWFTYREGLAYALDNFLNTEVYMSKLGSFKVKDYRLNNEINRVEDKIKGGQYHEKIVEGMETYVENLKRMQDIYDRINLNKQTFDELYFKAARNISEQNQDLGRSTQ